MTEFEVDVPLGASLDVHDLSAKEEQSDFFAWTDLIRLRPDCNIEASAPGGYLDLIAHINRHRRQLEAENPSHLGQDEAITHWYDHVYLPTVTAISPIRRPRVLRHRLPADLYVAVANHQLLRAAETGQIVNMHEALHDYLRQFSWRVRLARLWRSMLVRLRMGPGAAPNHPDLREFER